MSGNTPTIKNKVSSLVQGQLPEFIKQDHPLFATFLKHYYQFLEAAEITLGGSNDYVVQETNSVNYILDQNNERVVLESSAGKFITGETVVGSETGYTAKILVDDYDNTNRLFITSQQRFKVGETITGQTSGASASMVSYRANPVQNIQQLLAYADVDNTVYSFLDKFKDSLLESLPESIADEVSTRKLIKHIKDLYEAKGTEDGHKLFFRILFDEEATFIYPRDNMLRVSDGQWSDDYVMRVIEDGTSDFTQLIGEMITGKNSMATAVISSIVKFKAGSKLVTQINLDQTTIDGVFEIGETVTGISNSLDLEISATVSSIIGVVDIEEAGQYYEVGDEVHFENLGTIGVRGQVSDVGQGGIDEVHVADGGSGYSLGDELEFNNANTDGNYAKAKIAVVGGSFQLESATSPDGLIGEDHDENIIVNHVDSIAMEDATFDNVYFALEDDSGSIRTEDNNYFVGENVSGDDAGNFILEDDYKLLREESLEFDIGLETDFDGSQLLLESGHTIILEEDTFNDLGVPNEIGEITKVRVTDTGNGYRSLPTLTIGTTDNPTSGSGAELIPLSHSGVGKILKVKVTNYGLEYTGVPKVTFNRTLIVKNPTGDFIIGDTFTNYDALIVNWNPDSRILEVETPVGHWQPGDVVISASGVSATVVQCEHAIGSTRLDSVIRTEGNYITDRGKVSQDTMKIQDSFYYQDYSYVVRIGQSINEWRESVRRSVHPSGWNVFGEVSFASQVSATMQVPAAGDVIDYIGDDVFTPELASTFTNLFTTIFGRRLGTVNDGTTQRVSAAAGVAEPSELPPLTRDVTLVSSVTAKIGVADYQTKTMGPTLENVVRYGFNVHPVSTSNPTPNTYDPNGRRITTGDNFSRDQYSLAQIGHIGIRELCLADGSIPESAFTTRINFMPPSEIYISRSGLYQTFDMDFTKFDDGINTFDEAEFGVGDFDRTTVSFDSNITFDSVGLDTFDISKVSFDSNTSFDSGVHTFDRGDNQIDTEGRHATSFDEEVPNFDSDAITFDTASGNEQDYEVKTFDESDDTFDVSTNSFDASNSTGRISLFSTRAQTFDNSTETYDTQ